MSDLSSLEILWRRSMPNPLPRRVSETPTLYHNWRIDRTARTPSFPSTEPTFATIDIDCDMDDRQQSADASEASATDGWQWVMVTDPSKTKDRKTMRNVRAHVMNNYLHREQQNPNSTDVRVRNPNARRNRPKAISTPSYPDEAVKTTSERQTTPPVRSFEEEEANKEPEPTQGAPYFPLCGLGSRYDAFNMVPRFDNKEIDVEMLKSMCTTYFGSRAMCKKWVPLLVTGRTAFLSTLCIASAYLDLMQMEIWNPRKTRTPGSIESVRTLSVRDETVRMIAQNLSDPKTCSDDANIVAVLQMLCGDMIVGEYQTMILHEQGMWSMVEQRGGLNKLGGDGVIAITLIIKMFELSIFRECRPRPEYLDYASRFTASSRPNRRSAFPESPLYCPSGVYRTLGRSGMCSADTLEVINTARDLTQAVLDLQKWTTLFGPAPVGLDDMNTLEARKKSLIYRTLSYLPNYGDPVYEATRLCASLYANAIFRNTSFSETARSMELTEGTGCMPTAIRRQLMRTNLSTCWNEMVGILFWIMLVSSAACNESTQRPEAREGTDTSVIRQGTRRWFVAMIIRCSILLGFQHTDAILRSLQTALAVQDVLRSGEDEFMTMYQALDDVHGDMDIP